MKHVLIALLALCLCLLVWGKFKTPTTGSGSLVQTGDTKECYWCKESVKVAALICKHCGKTPDYRPAPSPQDEIINTSRPAAPKRKKMTDLERWGFKDRTKSVKQLEIIRTLDYSSISSGLFKGPRTFERRISFDKHGNLLELIELDSGKVENKRSFKYDEKGNHMETWTTDANGKSYISFALKYDENGNRVQSEFDAGGAKTSFTKYDARGNKVEEVGYDASGKMESKRAYKYDERGNKVEYVNCDASGKIESMTISKFDRKTSRLHPRGNPLGGVSSDSNGKITGKSTCKYDKNGNPVEFVDCDASGKIESKTTYKHDAKGNLVEMAKCDASGEVRRMKTFQYGDVEYVDMGRMAGRDPFNSFPHHTGSVHYIERNGKFVKDFCHKFDGKGNKLETEGYYDDGVKVRNRTIYKYDNNGNAFGWVEFLNPSQYFAPLRAAFYKHDEKGNKVNEDIYENKGWAKIIVDGKIVDQKTRLVLEKETTWQFTYWN